MSEIDFVKKVIAKSISSKITVYDVTKLAGGCINETLKISTSQGQYFLKYNRSVGLDFFDKESKGLQLLQQLSPFRLPNVVDCHVINNVPYLLLEYMDSSRPIQHFWSQFGIRLAQMHANTQSDYGHSHDNYIGTLIQTNNHHKNWHDFFEQERILPQLYMTEKNHLIEPNIFTSFYQLLKNLPQLVPSEKPALIHGDLWNGNFMVDHHGEAALIDPAVYYGHRESDLAFTHLFGGFDKQFYQAYEEVSPLAPDFIERKDIYNLYPLLVHLNLFGTSYLPEIRQILKRFM